MHIRPAGPQDKPTIVDLLKKSLGESVIPKSESFWTWKHEENPFGSSYVLLAELDDTLIGLRAFMKWQWQWKGEVYHAIRAVDTATHPDHQGKGIFKKLTLQLAESCRQQGVHFIFNTPNQKSGAGYLKMGWVEQGKMPLKVNVRKPVALLYNKFFDKDKFANDNISTSPSPEWKPEISDLLHNYIPEPEVLSTRLSTEYITWRYVTNPLHRYQYFTDDDRNFLLISRIKNHSFSKELRMVDFIILNNKTNQRLLNSYLKKTILHFCKLHNIGIISMSGVQYNLHKSYFKWMGLLPVRSMGPNITLRDLNMEEDFPSLLEVKNWGYSLGDMELF
ncbi:MAG TPA: GNAT family N-acetyltransferase [Chitinophagaceae bacterium]|nr:GNAT family N-acetyltransferase [Chitinophagaceae bacterium]